MNRINILLVVGVFLFLASSIFGEGKTLRMSSLKSESDDQSSLVSILFDKGIPTQKVQFEEHGTFIQIKIPNTLVLESGKFYDGNSPYFRKIATFQIDDITAGIRLFATQETKSIIGSLSSEYLNDRLLIHLDHKTVKPVHIDDSPPVSEIIARTTVRKDIEDPAKKVERSLAASESPPNLDELKEKLSYIAAISAVFLVIFGLFVVFKRIVVKKNELPSDIPITTMKTLASYPLAPKQKLTLIQVGHQKILLGVSPDSISYLTTIEENQPTGNIQNHMVNQTRAQFLQEPNSSVTQPIRSSTQKKLEPLPKKTRTDSPTSVAEKILRSGSSAMDTQGKYEGVRAEFSSKKSEPKSIEDVTNLIRSKLKNLPSV